MGLCINCLKLYCREEPREGFFCINCRSLLESCRLSAIRPLREDDEACRRRVWILFHYRGEVRDLILRSKARCEWQALLGICHLVAEQPELDLLIEWADALMAAPSSLWGRVRGKFDIAGFLVHELAEKSGKPALTAPWRLFWRYAKQAKIPSRQRRNASPASRWRLVGRGMAGNGIKKLLIIDDVFTSGMTMSTMIAELDGLQLRFLALAGSSPDN